MTILSTLALASAHARAEVWGYIDEQGRAHVATEKLDDRYRLFFKGATKGQIESGKARAEPAQRRFGVAQCGQFARARRAQRDARGDPLQVGQMVVEAVRHGGAGVGEQVHQHRSHAFRVGRQ